MNKGKYLPTIKYSHLTPADYIRLACELKDITQADIARQAGIHPTHLSEIVHGKRQIGSIVAKKLSKVIGVSVSRLLGEDEVDEMRKKKVDDTLARMKRHIKAASSISDDTERILLKDIDDAIEANREAS